MRDAVLNAFVGFSTPLEGKVAWMYQDVKGLVSTGMGNLIDPYPLAAGLPFMRADDTPASPLEILSEWTRVKNLPPDTQGRTAAMLGHLYAQPFTTLHLTDEGIAQLCKAKLAQNDRFMWQQFPGYEAWPCDAQLGVLSMAWACGPLFAPLWPKLSAALRAGDFVTASVECFMPEERTISGLRPRNVANRLLFTNAAIVMKNGLDRTNLYWPSSLDLADVSTFPVVHPPVDLSV